jgi:UDP-N-acetylglucosamine 2-epimerase (non-hydrolysing)
MRIKTLCVFGTRPEAIKMAPLVRQLSINPVFENKVCVSEQHVQMLHSVLNIFDIVPDFNLSVMTSNQNLAYLTSKILSGLHDIFESYTPDIVLTHGDTTTCLAASLAAYYHRIPIGHVEAGLRTGDLYLPWPEEMNRKLTDAITMLYFAPTEGARTNLLKEGVSEEKIYITGNTVVDALFYSLSRLETDSALILKFKQQFSFLSDERRMILVTGHRRESFGEGFEQICTALKHIALQLPDVDIVYPVHLNPNVQEPVYRLLADHENIHLISPVDYLPFVYLMKECYCILTDSGGVQEEAPSLGKPVLVMRDKTERPEAVRAGTVRLVGTKTNEIVQQVVMLFDDQSVYQRMSLAQNPYGDGNASERIVHCISNYFGRHSSLVKSNLIEKNEVN